MCTVRGEAIFCFLEALVLFWRERQCDQEQRKQHAPSNTCSFFSVFVAGEVSACSNWVCEGSPPVSFGDCVVMASLALERCEEWASREELAAFKAPQPRSWMTCVKELLFPVVLSDLMFHQCVSCSTISVMSGSVISHWFSQPPHVSHADVDLLCCVM